MTTGAPGGARRTWLRFSDSVGHWLTGSLAQWLTGSLAHWLAGSLAHWLTGSLADLETLGQLRAGPGDTSQIRVATAHRARRGCGSEVHANVVHAGVARCAREVGTGLTRHRPQRTGAEADRRRELVAADDVKATVVTDLSEFEDSAKPAHASQAARPGTPAAVLDRSAGIAGRVAKHEGTADFVHAGDIIVALQHSAALPDPRVIDALIVVEITMTAARARTVQARIARARGDTPRELGAEESLVAEALIAGLARAAGLDAEEHAQVASEPFVAGAAQIAGLARAADLDADKLVEVAREPFVACRFGGDVTRVAQSADLFAVAVIAALRTRAAIRTVGTGLAGAGQGHAGLRFAGATKAGRASRPPGATLTEVRVRHAQKSAADRLALAAGCTL